MSKGGNKFMNISSEIIKDGFTIDSEFISSILSSEALLYIVLLIIIIIVSSAFRLEEGKLLGFTFKKKDKVEYLITFPAGAPVTQKLPKELENLLNELLWKHKKHILLFNKNVEMAERVAEILFEKISSKKIGTHLGWVDYKYSPDKECDIVKAIDEEFLIFPNESDPLVRKSKKLDFLGKENKHTILFIKIEKYDKEKDYLLKRITNYKGLSVILMSDTIIDSFDIYSILEEKGEYVCIIEKS